MCKFRCRSNYLPISQSGFFHVTLVDVGCLCQFCHGQIDDGIHYLVVFTLFYKERQNSLEIFLFIQIIQIFTRYRNYLTQKILMIWRKLLSLLISSWKYSNIEMTGVFLSIDYWIVWLLYLYIVKRPCLCIDIQIVKAVSTLHYDVIKWKHFPRYWPFVPVPRTFDVYFDLRLNKRLSKQSWGWWFETLSSPLWRHSNALQSNTWWSNCESKNGSRISNAWYTQSTRCTNLTFTPFNTWNVILMKFEWGNIHKHIFSCAVFLKHT